MLKTVFHFFVAITQINKHKPGKANATGPFERIAKPSAAAAIYNCFTFFSWIQVNALNKPSVMKHIRYGSGTDNLNSKIK
jgi:hypothetical protein